MLADYQRLMRHLGEPQSIRSKILAPKNDAPDDNIALAIWNAQTALATELLAQIHAREPEFFEELVIDVFVAMGYGTRRRDLARRLGRSSDGGVDGLIWADELGLDLIYLQAKRLKPGNAVPISEVRDFAGSLDAHRASKGIFVATSHFSTQAASFCKQVSRRVVLVDGVQLAELMIRHNIGVSVHQSYQIKRVDADYFRRGVSPR